MAIKKQKLVKIGWSFKGRVGKSCVKELFSSAQK
jgi:hypothetical protein